MCATRGINIQEMVHFPNLSQENTHRRPQSGQAFLYYNGAFRLFNGVMPESVLQRCREYAELVEGCLWGLAKKNVPREDGKILHALDLLFRSITEFVRNPPSTDLEDDVVAPAAQQRGVKRRMHWLEIHDGAVARYTGDLDEKEVMDALRELALDKWCVGKPTDERLKTWGAQEALNCQSMLRKLAVKVETAEIMKR